MQLAEIMGTGQENINENYKSIIPVRKEEPKNTMNTVMPYLEMMHSILPIDVIHGISRGHTMSKMQLRRKQVTGTFS